MKLAFSTVACPDWTLRTVAQEAEDGGWSGVELRTFGAGGAAFACDPALSDPAKTLAHFRERGADVVSVATGLRFDEPVYPPVLGHALRDYEGPVRECKRAVELAGLLEAPVVRVFAFELARTDSFAGGVARVVERLALAAATALNTGVRVAVENGGSFPRASDLAMLLDRVNSPLLGASYNAAVAQSAGEDPADGAALLGQRLLCLKLKDLRSGKPVALGEGQMVTRPVVEALAKAGSRVPVIYEFDAAWLPTDQRGDDAVRAVLRRSAQTLGQWVGGAVTARRARAAAAARAAQPV